MTNKLMRFNRLRVAVIGYLGLLLSIFQFTRGKEKREEEKQAERFAAEDQAEQARQRERNGSRE